MSCGSVEKQLEAAQALCSVDLLPKKFVRRPCVSNKFSHFRQNIATTKTSTTTIYDLHSFGLLRDALSQCSHRLLCM